MWNKWAQFCFKFLIVVAACYIASRVGLYLQMPSGQASIIWPASGIAMGVVYVLGHRYALAVFLAAFLNSLYFYDVIDFRAISIACCIAIGTALQASAGSLLFSKYINRSTTLENIPDISKLLLLGGGVACMISALVATSTLYYAGVVEAQAYAAHLYSWWLGDVFGVLIFTPLIILNFSKEAIEKNISLKRKLFVSVPILLVFTIFLVLFFNTKNELEERAYLEYEEQVVSLVNEFKRDLVVDFSSLVGVTSFFNASEYVSAEEFKIFTDSLLMNSSSIFGVSWLPKIYHPDRERFEKSIQDQGYVEFSIKDRAGKGALEKSTERPFYFPLAYTQPYNKNKKAHGFDVYGVDVLSGDLRRAILDNARDTGQKKATGRLPIVQQEDQYGFIVYEPVYERSAPYSSIEDRRKNHIGYINGIFVFPQLMGIIHKKTMNLGLDIILQDTSTLKGSSVLFDSRTPNFKEGELQSYLFDSVLHVSKEFNVGGRDWKITVIKNTHLLSQAYVKELWVLVLVGVLFNTLLGVFLMVITARTEIVEKLVYQKTFDLQQANAELEEFAYRTSHDLRSPLVSSIGLLGVIEGMMQKGEHENVLKGVDLVKGSLEKLETLVQDTLALTHLKGVEEELVTIDFEEMVREALEKFTHMDNFDRLKIQTELKLGNDVKALKSRVSLIVENLITNSIKYQDTDKQDSYIKIVTYKSSEGAVFEVEDNGLGIPLEKQKDLFQMFARFHPRVSYGSGLGLYMMKKSADILDARIVFEDTANGSNFKLILPL